MVCLTVIGNYQLIRLKKTGFTLIELLIVLAIVGLLASIAIPNYFGAVDRSKEAVLKQDLAIMRDALDKFYGDAGKYPDSLDELVEKKYIRKLPVDPITNSNQTWVVVPPESGIEGAVSDIKSGATSQASDGTNYSLW
jgi:general secretion pathway protein G